MQRLYEEGQDRIETELDLVKLTKNLRNMKMLMRSSLMSNQVKFEIRHAYGNLINLDSDTESDHAESASDDKENDIDEGNFDTSVIRLNLRKKNKKKMLKWAHKFKRAVQNISSKKKLNKRSAATIITRWSRDILYKKYRASKIVNPQVHKIIEEYEAEGYFDHLRNNS